MKRSTFSINLICRGSKADKKGLSSIEAVITKNGERTVIKTEYKISKADFDKGKADDFIESKREQLYGIVAKLNREGIPPTPENIKKVYRGESLKKSFSVLDIMDEYSEYVRGNGSSSENWRKHLTVRGNLEEYLKRHPVSVEEINSGWVKGFQNWLCSFQDTTTVAGKMQKVRSAWLFAIDNGRVVRNPFVGVRLQKKTKDAVFLTEAEVEVIMKKDFHVERLNKIRDLFLFCCFTGLAYGDLSSLRREDIRYDEKSGFHYIEKERLKTGVKYFVPLTEVPLAILERYDYDLPVISNQRINSYLAEIRDITGIEKKFTCHTARHSFATLLLNRGFDIATVSKCLGHSNLQITTHYARLLNGSILREFKRLI